MNKKAPVTTPTQEPLLETIVDHARTPIVAKSLDGRILFVNNEFSRLFCMSKSEVIGKTDDELFCSEIAEAFKADDNNVIAHNDVFVAEKRLLIKEGLRDYLFVKFPIPDAAGEMVAIGLVATEISCQKNKEIEYQRLAFTDYLTQLPNRNLFYQRLEQSIKRAYRYSNLVGLAMLDLDDFKPVNDTYGHHVGDSVLQEVSKRLLSSFREVDTVARLGGDEFAIIFDAPDSTEVVQKALERAVEKLCKPIHIMAQKINISASVGTAFYPICSTDPNKLMIMADEALYAAKKDGGKKVRFHTLFKSVSHEHLFL